MKHTGERHIPDDAFYHEADYYVHLMHLATYHFALDFVKGKDVLDYGSGSGYGALLLADVAGSVTATDVSDEAIGFAKQKHLSPNLLFKYMREIGDQQFDVITSFQVIEHIADTHDFIQRLKNLLRPGGVLILSTPDKSNRLIPYIQRSWNKYHLKEFSGAGLKKVTARYFDDVQLLKMSATESFVLHEISRRKKNKWISLPATLFFYPNFLRVFLLDSQSSLYNYFNRLRKKKTEKISGDKTTEYPFLKYTVDDIVIAEDPPYPTDLIVVCRGAK